ncbi:MAG: HAD family hydrolase [Bacillota bacterium]
MFRYDAVLFDLDGTLLDSVDDIADALNQTLIDFGCPTHSRQRVERFLGSGAYQLLKRALPERADDAVIHQALARYHQLYLRHQNVKTRPYPGVLPMLAALDEAGLKLAVISNKSDENVKHLTKAHFGSLIHVAVGDNDNVPLKPEPDMLRLALQKLHVTPAHALYIGDAPTDYYAAKNAGANCILARWGYGDPRELSLLPPLYFASDPAELPMLILQEQEDMQ